MSEAMVNSKGRAIHKLRWRHDMCLLGNTVVGNIEYAEHHKLWFAYACDVDWQDTNLGTHKTMAAAKRAVTQWLQERI